MKIYKTENTDAGATAVVERHGRNGPWWTIHAPHYGSPPGKMLGTVTERERLEDAFKLQKQRVAQAAREGCRP